MSSIPDKIYIHEGEFAHSSAKTANTENWLKGTIEYIRADKVKEYIKRIERDILEPDKIDCHIGRLKQEIDK
jgi:hypothetical protein